MNQVFQINLNDLNNGINSLTEQISILQSDLEFKVKLRNYIAGQGAEFYSKTSAEVIKPNSSDFNTLSVKATETLFGTAAIPITDFVISELSIGSKKAKDLIESYSTKTGINDNLLRNRFYNTLTRLKDKGQIENKIIPGYKGGIWEKIKTDSIS